MTAVVRPCYACGGYLAPVGKLCHRCAGCCSYNKIQHNWPLAVKEGNVLADRLTWDFDEETQWRTNDCLQCLYCKTTEAELLDAAGGNKWIARRAIELYKRGLEIVNYRTEPGRLNADGTISILDGRTFHLDMSNVYATKVNCK